MAQEPLQNDGICRGNGGMTRREVVKLAGFGAAAALIPGMPLMAGPFVSADFQRLIPLDKKLRPEWLASLAVRGEPETYHGQDLRFIGMPVGGLFCGTLYLSGDGRLWLWDIFNRNQGGILSKKVEYRGADLNLMAGAAYVAPAIPDDYRLVEQGFTIGVKTAGQTIIRSLDAEGFKQVSFTGQYPIGRIEYRDPAIPVRVTLEAFSPFLPHQIDDSSLPATIFAFHLSNTLNEPVEVELEGVLENAACRGAQYWSGTRRNEWVRGEGMSVVHASVVPRREETPRRSDVLFEDWSKPTYEGWHAEGDAFGTGPILRKSLPAYQGDVGGDTERVVNSHGSAPGGATGNKDAATGKLTSRSFTITRRFINLWIGGGSHAGRTCVNLLVEGKTVESRTGRDDNRMTLQSLAVGKFEGKEAVLQIVDDERGGWGNIGVGRITFSDLPAGAVEASQQPDFGTMCLALLGAPAEISSGNAEVDLDRKLVGRLGRRITLAPQQSADVTFLVAWHFPNVGILPAAKRHYSARFRTASDVARYVSENIERLVEQTRLWRDTWNDSTLPHWFLNRTFANTANLATTTCHRFQDGRFWAWEGIGCCAGTCTHVWHYAHALARLFPSIERDQRERVDFGLALQEDGVISFRAEHGKTFAADGQAGRILGAYREHQMSSSDAFLRRIWPKIRRAAQRLMEADPKRDGLLKGPLHNTLDADWFGYVPWLCGLYHAALRAGEQMAGEMGDAEFAKACRTILNVAPASLDAACWKEEYQYFVHRGDAEHPKEVGSYDGCHIDQVFGQSWAWQVGLGRVMMPAHVKAALKSLWKYNFTPDVGPWREAKKAGRWYAIAGDGGTIMVTFPFEADRSFTGSGAWSAMYFNECMTGFEHQVASHMMWEGMVTESLAITRAIHDRYSARLRNPYNETECSDHYARAMASYGTYLAACGSEHHGPQAHIGFAPRITPDDFKAAFTTAEGWGSFAQKREGNSQRARLDVKWGSLRLRTLNLAVTLPVKNVDVQCAGTPVPASHRVQDGIITITLNQEQQLTPERKLEVVISLA